MIYNASLLADRDFDLTPSMWGEIDWLYAPGAGLLEDSPQSANAGLDEDLGEPGLAGLVKNVDRLGEERALRRR
jgi:hypothetical protein